VRFETGPASNRRWTGVDVGVPGRGADAGHGLRWCWATAAACLPGPTPTRLRRFWRHAEAFAHFGVARHDPLRQPAAIVTSRGVHRPVVWTRASRTDGLLRGGGQAVPVLPAQTKGKVESGVSTSRQSSAAGAFAISRTSILPAGLVPGATAIRDDAREASARFARAETLIRSRPVAVPAERVESRSVPRDSYVAVETNRYPCLWSGGQTVEVGSGAGGLDTSCRFEPVHSRCRVSISGCWQGPPRKLRGASGPSAGHRVWIRLLVDLGEWLCGRWSVRGGP